MDCMDVHKVFSVIFNAVQQRMQTRIVPEFKIDPTVSGEPDITVDHIVLCLCPRSPCGDRSHVAPHCVKAVLLYARYEHHVKHLHLVPH
jgi:hypothetical protein